MINWKLRRRLARFFGAAWFPALIVVAVGLITMACLAWWWTASIPGEAEQVLGGSASCGTAERRTVTCVRDGAVFVCVKGDDGIRCAQALPGSVAP